MEQKIGNTFYFGLDIIKVVKGERDRILNFCDNRCIFLVDGFCCKSDNAGPCRGNERSDNTDVMFVSIGKVNTKKNNKRKK